MSDPLRILVLGYLVRGPLGGLAWHHLQYVLGLERLGHDVWFLEDSGEYAACYDPESDSMTTDPSYGLEFARRAFDRLGLGGRWAYLDHHTDRWLGPARSRAPELQRSADLLLDLSGVNPPRDWWSRVPVRALVDTDPAFTQVRHRTDPEARAAASAHTRFFTFAENLPSGRSTIPDDGFDWASTRQPVVLDAWPRTKPPTDGPFTTVMQWDSYATLEHEGVRYGMKSDSFEPYLDLPARTHQRLELAVGSDTAPRERLEASGWRVLDPRTPTADPWTYQAYLQGSKAEFGVAKHGYVATRSGWFSERSAGYMASGRAVVVQDTGFSDVLPTGEGLLAFSEPEGALAGIEEVAARPVFHGRRAREVVEAHFGSGEVLGRLLEGCG